MTCTTVEWMLSLEEGHLRSLLDAGLHRARQHDHPTLVSLVLPAPPSDPLVLFARSTAFASNRIFWSSPDARYALAGLGNAWTLEVDGTRPFAAATAAWNNYISTALIEAPVDISPTGPLLLGGFAFDPLRPATPLWQGFPAGRLALPRYMLSAIDGNCWLTINTLIGPSSNPAQMARALLQHLTLVLDSMVAPSIPVAPHQALTVEDVLPAQEWMTIVAGLVQEMRQSGLEKVVLARECRVQGSQPFDPAAVLDWLRNAYPNCFAFAVARGTRCFLGASPERLVSLREGTVLATSLAGSIRRGSNEEEDRRLGAALLASAKERTEHAIVARMLADALADFCSDLSVAPTPTLMKMQNVQHLFTPIVGRLAGEYSILDLVARLHPTPAVGGAPRHTALQLIREREQLDRGWYAGPVGWVDRRGEGEFAVAIRSALLRGATASLFAGCGIVANSDPESEYAESRLKLRPLLAALSGGAQ